MGVDIPGHKRIDIALRYMYGIGPAISNEIIEATGIKPSIRAKDLTDDQLSKIVHAIQDGQYMIEGDLRREISMNLKRMQAIKCYRGIRHIRGLPVRGQRTSTNARSRKGARKTVGIQRNPNAKSGIHWAIPLIWYMAEEEQKKVEETEATSAAKPEAVEASKEAKPEAAKASKEAKPEAAKASKEVKPEAEGKEEKKAEGKTDDGPAPAEAPSAAELLSTDLGPAKIVKAKGSKNVVNGIATICATFNNTLVSITDMHGNVVSWSSAGKVGFRGSRKSTAFAAQQVAQDAGRQAMSHGLKEVEIRVKGPGSGRESAIRALQAIGLEINGIKDVTPVPHNGCRPRKKRRV